MLSAAAGAMCSVVCQGPEAEDSGCAGSADPQTLTGVLLELDDVGAELATSDGAVRLEVGGGQSAMVTEVRLGPERVGRIAVMPDASLPAERQTALEAMLLDVAASAGAECRVAEEADALAEELSARYEELNLLYAMDGSAHAGDDGVASAEAVLRNLVERLEIDVAALVLPDRQEPIHATSLSQPLRDMDLLLTAMRGDLFRFAATSKNPVVLNTSSDPRRQYLFVDMPYRILACPVIDQGMTRAMLVMLRLGSRPEFTNGDRNLGMVVANQTAIMMQNHAMMKSLAKFGAEMAASLIEAIEAKDPYTRVHSERVQKCGVELAKAADLGATAVEDVSWGALLHDVGKIGIPDTIICKAGSLSEDEYTMMKTHPERSFEIIRHIDHLSRAALGAARHHHERFDGNGYPLGLRGSQIPIEARVVSIADTYDAIKSSRSYRAGRSHEQALAIIRECAGSQLDPRLVEIFDNIWRHANTGGDRPLGRHPRRQRGSRSPARRPLRAALSAADPLARRTLRSGRGAAARSHGRPARDRTPALSREGAVLYLATADPAQHPELTIEYSCECDPSSNGGVEVLQPGPGSGKDAHGLAGAQGDKNYGAQPSLWVDDTAPYNALLQFDLSALPANAIVTDAQLDLYVAGFDDLDNGQVSVHRVTRDWGWRAVAERRDSRQRMAPPGRPTTASTPGRRPAAISIHRSSTT
jgi:HD-GYP domain-containing protein (c-di-GMP phosphodiesterase class II)